MLIRTTDAPCSPSSNRFSSNWSKNVFPVAAGRRTNHDARRAAFLWRYRRSVERLVHAEDDFFFGEIHPINLKTYLETVTCRFASEVGSHGAMH